MLKIRRAALTIYNPIDLLKTRAQINRQEFIKYRKLVPELIHNEGFIGLYKGFIPGLLRDVPGTGTYFWTFAYLKKRFELDDLTGTKHKLWR